MQTSPILEIKKASLTFGDKAIWSNLNLSVLPGEFIAVIGANGSGKTVLLTATAAHQLFKLICRNQCRLIALQVIQKGFHILERVLFIG
jgi:ABC-type molybdenum transport system ATPase subunit/photorepair protein PhrA